jgi:hypothetical protein
MTRPALLLVALVALASAQEPAPKVPVDAFGDPLPPGAVARLGTVRFRTADFPKQLAVSPDGKRVVSTQSMQHVRLTVWEVDTGRQIREVELSDYPQPEVVCWPAEGRAEGLRRLELH